MSLEAHEGPGKLRENDSCAWGRGRKLPKPLMEHPGRWKHLWIDGDRPALRVRLIRVTAAVACLAGVPACGPDAPKKPVATDKPPRTNAGLMHQLDAMTDGAHVRLVWVEHRTRRGFDPFGEQSNYRLVGFDSREGGFRFLAKRRTNYSRPLFTPDGSAVVFTERRALGTDSPATPSVIRLIEWNGGRSTDLGAGLAVSVWRDWGTGEDWVYYIDDAGKSSPRRTAAQNVHRFPLRNPERREVAWQGTPLSVDNFHISRDGLVFAALFPWPEAGVADFAERRWRKLDLGCWSALAPDNSRVSWVFDGGHKRLRVFDSALTRIADLDFRDAPKMKGHAAFHPRWSNHPRFMVMTGPYVSEQKGREALEAGAGRAEVHLGKLKPDCSGFETWAAITSNSAGDFFPDAWIEGGEKATLNAFAQWTGKSLPPPPPRQWPAQTGPIEFVWSDARADNKVAERPLACAVEARRTARYGRHFDMLLDGGSFEADRDSAAAWLRGVSKSNSFFMQMALTEFGEGALPGETVSLVRVHGPGRAGAVLARSARGLKFRLPLAAASGPIGWSDEFVTDALSGGEMITLAIVWNRGELAWFINGKLARSAPRAPESRLALEPTDTIVFGEEAILWPHRWWHAEKILLSSTSRAVAQVTQEADATAAATSGRSKTIPLRLKGRVVEATAPEPDRLELYHRMLVDHTYEVVEIAGGTPLAARDRIVVLHWAMLDERPVVGIPKAPGAMVDLLVDPASAHPELESELTITNGEPALPLYYELTPSRIE
jgi:hypothetical protein